MENRLILILGIVMSLIFSVGCQGTAGLAEADRTTIRQADENYAKFKGVAGLYTEDAILMPPSQAAVQGRAAIMASWEGLPPISNFQLQVLEVEGRADLAYSRETYSIALSPTAAAPDEDHGKILAIWRTQADGSWKVLRDIWNSDLPLPAPEKPAARAKKTE